MKNETEEVKEISLYWTDFYWSPDTSYPTLPVRILDFALSFSAFRIFMISCQNTAMPTLLKTNYMFRHGCTMLGKDCVYKLALLTQSRKHETLFINASFKLFGFVVVVDFKFCARFFFYQLKYFLIRLCAIFRYTNLIYWFTLICSEVHHRRNRYNPTT